MQNINWMKTTLKFAGVYNILWGAYAVLLPTHFFTTIGIELPRYIEFWQCIGMIVGVYGIGYWLAASDPLPIIPLSLWDFSEKYLAPLDSLKHYILRNFPLSLAIPLSLMTLFGGFRSF